MIPKPSGLVKVNKHDFISRSNKSLEKFDQNEIQKENLVEFSKEFKIKPCLKERNLVPAQSKNVDKSNKIISETHDKNPLSSYDANKNINLKFCRIPCKKFENKMNSENNLDELERNVMSPEKLRQTAKLLESKLNFQKHNRVASESPKSINRIEDKKFSPKPQNQIISKPVSLNKNPYTQPEISLVQNKQTENVCDEKVCTEFIPGVVKRKSVNNVSRKIRNLDLDENFEPSHRLDNFSRESITSFENKINFFESIKALESSSTKSLNNVDEKTISIETYEIPRILLNKNNEIFGSTRSLESFSTNQIHVDNLNEIPRILGSLNNKQNLISRSNKSLENYDPSKTEIIFESPNEIPKILNSMKSNQRSERAKNLTPAPIKPRRSIFSNAAWVRLYSFFFKFKLKVSLRYRNVPIVQNI